MEFIILYDQNPDFLAAKINDAREKGYNYQGQPFAFKIKDVNYIGMAMTLSGLRIPQLDVSSAVMSMPEVFHGRN